eukprot:TRINITY_DN607_c0_g1_i2.p2 TRINITY_DN607_c0_g1~~TRINITY_DN607_c0_g1_i2.p2  ORF type:complete len:106 (-),score=13.15 TRINITY_DN607_c0_g1_i2:19-336(-)
MWDQEAILSMLGPDEFGLADKGYEGAPRLLTPWKGKGLNAKQKAWNYIVESSRVMVENSFARLVNMDLKFRPIRKATPSELCKFYETKASTTINAAHYDVRDELP